MVAGRGGLALGVGLSLFRLAPAAMTYGHVQREFATGFPDLLTLGRAFVSLLTVDTPPVPAPDAGFGWWEFDHYVGWAAPAFVLVYLFRRAPGAPADAYPRRVLLFGAAVLAVFSLFRLYAPIAGLPLPLLNAERITTRFISVAFFVALACACTRFDRDATNFSTAGRLLALALLGYTLVALGRHSAAWQPALLEAAHPPSSYWPDSATMTAHIVGVPREIKYKFVTAAAWVCSTGTFLLSVLWWRRPRPDTPPSGV